MIGQLQVSVVFLVCLQTRGNLNCGWLFGSFQTWNFLDSTATPWTDVNFDDQFLRTLGNNPFLFLGFGGTFQSEVWYLFFRSNDSLDGFFSLAERFG
ncbi:unnamed protein product [Rhizophagus irregularis]|uniref:Secreted protein n=1 Tax=Rhizophagus irregularis TaxID=588596 RepID=A0A915ZU70_9GLOM|nr:unnamed protein product [Rhizophagus irregularis]